MNYITRVYTVVQVTVLVRTCTECARGFEDTYMYLSLNNSDSVIYYLMSSAHLSTVAPSLRSVTPSNQNVDDEPPSRSASPLP